MHKWQKWRTETSTQINTETQKFNKRERPTCYHTNFTQIRILTLHLRRNNTSGRLCMIAKRQMNYNFSKKIIFADWEKPWVSYHLKESWRPQKGIFLCSKASGLSISECHLCATPVWGPMGEIWKNKTRSDNSGKRHRNYRQFIKYHTPDVENKYKTYKNKLVIWENIRKNTLIKLKALVEIIWKGYKIL